MKAWNASNMSEKKVLRQQPEAILDFAVSPLGKQLAVARFDGVGELQDLATGKADNATPSSKAGARQKPERLVADRSPDGEDGDR